MTSFFDPQQPDALDQNAIRELYSAWDTFNDPLLLIDLTGSYYSSCPRGNYPIVKPNRSSGLFANAQHEALRGAVSRIAKLFNPELQPDPRVSSLYKALQTDTAFYKNCVRRTAQLQDIINGRGTSRRAKIHQNDLQASLASKRHYEDLQELRETIVHSPNSMTLSQKFEYAGLKWAASYADTKIACRLARFNHVLKQQDTLYLGYDPKSLHPVDNIQLSTSHDHGITDNKTSLGMKFVYLNEMREAVVDTTTISPTLSRLTRKHFRAVQHIYPNMTQMLIKAGLDAHPLVTSILQNEKDLFATRVAGQIEFEHIQTEAAAKQKTAHVVTLLHLDDRAVFDAARENYLQRQSKRPENNRQPTKRPVIPGRGACPF